MIPNVELALQVRGLVLEANEKLEKSMKLVEDNCPQPEFLIYKRAVGKVVTAILFEILEPLYETNPELKTPGWDV
jgi:hypothetical protein